MLLRRCLLACLLQERHNAAAVHACIHEFKQKQQHNPSVLESWSRRKGSCTECIYISAKPRHIAMSAGQQAKDRHGLQQYWTVGAMEAIKHKHSSRHQMTKRIDIRHHFSFPFSHKFIDQISYYYEQFP
jgi:hypothetical protein